MKLATDMLRVLYLVNVYQPISRTDLVKAFAKGKGGAEEVFPSVLRRLQDEKYISAEEPLSCRPRGLAALQSLQVYKIRDASRLFMLKHRAKFDSVDRTGGMGNEK